MTDDKYITMDDLPRLKKAYEQAVADGREVFVFDFHQVLTSYAKYLIEYMESRKEQT